MSTSATPRPLVTVIVPGRDVGEFARDAIASLRAQTSTRWRAILIDDGSVDATRTIFAEAAASDDRFLVVRHEEARGLGAARNAGLDLVDTPFVGFLDADDVMTPGALDALLGAITDSGNDVVVASYVRLRPSADGGYAPGTVQPWVSASTSPAKRGATLETHPAVSGNIVAWSKVSRIELWRAHGLRFPEGVLYEDQILTQQLYVHARGIDVIPDVVVHWRERADGSSITQGKHTIPVLRAYLDALLGGLGVLDAASLHAAAHARIRLILEMDTPPLVRIAERHEDAAYRRAVGAFVRTLIARADHERIALDAEAQELASAAALW